MRTRRWIAGMGLGLFLSVMGGCSSGDAVTSSASGQAAPPFVGGVQSDASEAPRPSISPLAHGLNVQIRARVTLSLAALRDRTFLYGSDLQYSGLNDGTTETADSTFAIGHVLAKFVDAGETLQLLQDQSPLFESDVNHPARLLHAFKILSRGNGTVTIAIDEASPALVTTIGGSSAAPARTSWVRSIQYVKDRDLLMFESSIEAADGTVYEFMESLFPRDALVPQDATPLLADPSAEPIAARFNLIANGKVWLDAGDGSRFETEVATRYHVTPGQVIEWYVTPNIPDDFIPDVQRGIEGWNRYSQAMWKKDIIAFRGRLPADVKIGDPRYNVVNWDTVQDAAAAYESQAADPLTGVQSHSLIYLPFAWFNFGLAEWTDGGLSEVKKTNPLQAFLDTHPFFGKKLRPACLRAIANDGTVTVADDPTTFAHELVRGTLFHEVGHAFGLGHNFKASTSYDLTTPTTYTTSIMDYNLYELDRASFTSPSSADGPLLEYDRQAISALYDGSKDIKDTDPVLPMCTDADVAGGDQQGAVDPFCLQYDGGYDPTVFLARNVQLVTDEAAKLGTIDSLAKTLRRVPSKLAAAATVKTQDDVDAAIADYQGHLQGVLSYFLRTRVARLAGESESFLSVFAKGSLPSGTTDASVHARSIATVRTIAGFTAVPAPVQAALKSAIDAAGAWLVTTPAIAQLPAAQRSAARDEALKPLGAVASWYTASLLPAVRGRVLGALVHSATLPYDYTKSPAVDYEVEVIGVLEAGMSSMAGSVKRPLSERTKVATALATFRDLDAGQAAASRVAAEIETEIANAANATERDGLRSLLAALGGP